MYRYHNKTKKQSQYQTILSVIEDVGLIPTTACTMPGLSGFAFEHQLNRTFNDLSIYCFEKNRNTYYESYFFEAKPENVKLINEDIENIECHKEHYDILWLDYTGRCNLNQKDVQELIKPNSVFAITEFKDRGFKKLELDPVTFKEVFYDEYSHMRFRCFSYQSKH